MSVAPEPVIVDFSPGGVAVVALNRPSKRNAMDEQMIAQLSEGFDAIASADGVRIVLLKGLGPAFCAGADIDWMRRQGAQSLAENEADALALATMLRKLHDLPQLTVALVHGLAIGGGAGLAAAADYVVAEAGATFRFSEVRLGLTPATIAPYVVEAIGARAARGLFASALPFDAHTALRLGLAHEVAEGEDGLDAASKRLAGLSLENAPGAVADAKALVRFIADDVTRTRAPVAASRVIDDHVLKETARRIAARRASEEGQEGLAAFLERRAPKWSG